MRKIYTLIALTLFTSQVFSQQQSIPEYCLENDVVHRYLTEVQYDPNDYSYSKIRDYCYDYPWNWEVLGNGVRLDIPKPVPFKFTKALDKVRILHVSETEDYEVDWTYAIGQNVDTFNVYNLIPGRTYFWKTNYDNEGVNTVAESGMFKTTGTLRMLKIDNVFNVRDMGGWIGLGGKPLKYGKIVRGSRLNVNKSTTLMITQDGIEELRKIGMRSELDMRDASNSVNATHAFFGNDCPILNVNAAYNSRIATFANGPQSIQGINQLIAWLKEGKPVYLHCSVGADRTGTVAYLVGALCGMSEDALCKEFELTSFSGDKIENEAARGTYERLIRQRDYTGRLDPNDNNESYKFAKMVDKIKTYPGSTLQQKVYYHLKTGVNGTKVSEDDLNWLIKEMVGYVMVKDIKISCETSIVLKSCQTVNLNATVIPSDATNPGITFSTSNEGVATVSDKGVITAVRGGTAKITIKTEDMTKTVTVEVPETESVIPDYALYNNISCPVSNSSRVINGSFEYVDPYYNWLGGNGNKLSDNAFDLKNYEGQFERYLESKMDGDASSEGSIVTEWRLTKNKNYVFGYKIKNSTDLATVSNANLKVYIKVNNSESVSMELDAPSYDGNWTDVQYIFNSGTNNRLRIEFTHLSQNGNNTCLDEFYLSEIDLSAGVVPVRSAVKTDAYDMSGRRVEGTQNGIIIKDGKKYINR